MNREQAKEIVKTYLGDYLQGNGINIYKPFKCLSPDHADKHPSMSYNRNGNYCHCFSCGANYDIFDLIGFDYGLTEHKDIFKKAYDLYNITIDQTQTAADQRQPAAAAVQKPIDYSGYYDRTRANMDNAAVQQYLLKRGISADTAKKYGLGFDPKYSTLQTAADGQQKFAIWQALIIPTSKSSYIARNINTVKEAPEKNRYRKKGESLLFNAAALYEADKPILITEGEIDALSILEVGGYSVGLGSAGNYRRLIELLQKKKPTMPLILALDNDEVGRKTQETLAAELTRLQVTFYQYNPYGAAKDANEALTIDRKTLGEEVKIAEQLPNAEIEAIEQAEKREYESTSAAAHIADFLDGVIESANTPVVSTGFNYLDELLDGGLYEGLYFIGAISSLGKTTLAVQIMDNLAASGQDVLYFSLEMSRHEIMSKSISRWTYLLASDKRNAKTSRGITAGARYAKYSKEEKRLINEAITKYKEYAAHIYIHEGIGDIGISQIKEIVERHIKITGNKPVVIIDYLQILAPYDIRATDKQNMDKAVLELKRLSRDNKITVIAISSFNRDSYKGTKTDGKARMTDFKESGAIEYSADVLMGLQFENVGNDYNEAEEKRKDPRRITLVVMKNRNGKAWQQCTFSYYPAFNYIDEN